MAGWTGSTPDCGSPTSWSPDFTKLLVLAIPPGKAVHHIALLDISTPVATLTDLTEPRQGKGFGDPVLDDSSADFIADTTGATVVFGGNIVAFQENTIGLTLDVRTPLSATTAVLSGHPEAMFIGASKQNTYREVSPDGMYVFSNDVLDPKVFPASDASTTYAPSCPTITGITNNRFLGWVNSKQLVYADDNHVGLVSVGNGLSCDELTPTTAKTLSNFRLSIDGQELAFTAAGTAGPEAYTVPPVFPAPKPKPGQLKTFPPGATVFTPGNY